MAYFDADKFADKYNKVFALKGLQSHLSALKTASFSSMADGVMTNAALRTVSVAVNRIHSAKDSRQDRIPSPSKHMKYISISTSNYSSVYVIADKRTHCITVGFRGTASLKSMRSYLKASSILPMRAQLCDSSDNSDPEDREDGYLIGTFKLVGEMYYTILAAIHMLSKDFLDMKTKNVKLVTTGHSLGGACAQVFAYLWIKKHPDHHICCNTFGAPRVMNVYAAEKFADLAIGKSKHILFRRVVTLGDPIPHLPLKQTSISALRTYSHVDETRDLDVGGPLVLMCTNFKKTRKLECAPKNVVKRNAKWTRRASVTQTKGSHGSYIGLRFEKMGHGVFNPLHEIVRVGKTRDTMCRVIVGQHDGTTISFFNLQTIKTPNMGALSMMAQKIKKVAVVDYTHADIYMTARVFADVVRAGTEMTTDTDPLRADNDNCVALNLVGVAPQPRLVCA